MMKINLDEKIEAIAVVYIDNMDAEIFEDITAENVADAVIEISQWGVDKIEYVYGLFF